MLKIVKNNVCDFESRLNLHRKIHNLVSCQYPSCLHSTAGAAMDETSPAGERVCASTAREAVN